MVNTEKRSEEEINQFIKNSQDVEYGDVYPLDIAYTLNGEVDKIAFKEDIRDTVPEEYIQFVTNILDSVSGTHRYLHYVLESYLVFCLLPIEVANELEAMQANKFIQNK